MSEDNTEIRFREITDAGQLRTIEELARRIFPKTYEGLIPAEQIPYMMRIMYDDAVLQNDDLIGVLDGGKTVGDHKHRTDVADALQGVLD